MGGAFEGELPDTVLSILKPGDVIFIQSFGWWVSWLILYLTNSHISHVAWYIGNHRISHATKNLGVIIEPIESLYDSDTRILPCIWHMPEETRSKIEAEIRTNWLNRPYDARIVVLKGLRIILGRDWPEYRWAFLFDISFFLLLIDLPLVFYFGFPVLSLLIPIYLLILLINRALSKRHPVSISYPHQWLNGLRNSGQGEFLLDAYHISQQLQQEKAKREKQ